MSVDQVTLLEKIFISQQKSTIKVILERVLKNQKCDVIYNSVMKSISLKESEKCLKFAVEFFSNHTYIEKTNQPNFETHVED